VSWGLVTFLQDKLDGGDGASIVGNVESQPGPGVRVFIGERDMAYIPWVVGVHPKGRHFHFRAPEAY